MVDRFEKMREQLIEHGKIKQDEELSKREIQKLYMKYQFEFMRAAAAKPKPPKKKKPAPKAEVLPKSKKPKKSIAEILGKQRQEFETKLKTFRTLRKHMYTLENESKESSEQQESIMEGVLESIRIISDEISELVLMEMEE